VTSWLRMEAADIHFNLRRNRPDCKRFPGDLFARQFLPRGRMMTGALARPFAAGGQAKF
jgi:hypothetical protein